MNLWDIGAVVFIGVLIGSVLLINHCDDDAKRDGWPIIAAAWIFFTVVFIISWIHPAWPF